MRQTSQVKVHNLDFACPCACIYGAFCLYIHVKKCIRNVRSLKKFGYEKYPVFPVSNRNFLATCRYNGDIGDVVVGRIIEVINNN